MNQSILDENFEQKNAKTRKEDIPSINILINSVNEKIGQIKIARGTFIFLGLISIFSSLYVHYYSSIHYLHVEWNWKTFGVILAPIIYFGCAIGISINHKTSILIGLLSFISMHIAYSYFDVFAIIMGLLLKFPVIYFLGSGLIASHKMESDIHTLGMLGLPKKDRVKAYALKKIEIL